MHVKKITIENFRGIRNIKIEFHKQMNVFIGINGSGKSSVLDMLAILFSHSRIFSDGELLSIDLRSIPYNANSIDASLECEALETNVKVSVKQSANEFNSKVEYGNPNHLDVRWKEIVEKHDVGFDFPLAVYYPTNRGILDIPERIRGYQPVENSMDSLKGALSNALDFRSFVARLRESEKSLNIIRNSQGFEFYNDWYASQAKAVKQAIENVVSGFTEIHVQQKPFDVVIKKGTTNLSLTQLSDGEKCLIALVGDLAQRLAIANPLVNEPLRGKAVVIIDEIDLHLHPQWQRMILPKLMETFPNCQFIVSTHSPQILGELRSENVFILADGENGIEARRPAYEIYGQTSGTLLEDMMQTPERDSSIKTKISDAYKALELGSIDDAKRLIGELRDQAADIPDLVRLDMRLSRKEVFGQ